MASAGSNIDDLLQCPICLEIFDQPKVLDCQHTFCANCLKIHHAAQSQSLPSIECPMCRRRTNLINSSIDHLPMNFIARDVIERQYGNRTIERSTHDQDEIRQRLKTLNKLNEEKSEEKQTDYMDYIKPAAAALVGVLGGLLLAKGVTKMTEKKKKSDK